MNLDEFIIVSMPKEDYGIRPRIYCNYGFNMSVHGGPGMYCEPGKKTDFYTKLEIGFPSEKEDLIIEFAENDYDFMGTVYGYVPTNIIQKVIDIHGGINIAETFKIRKP